MKSKQLESGQKFNRLTVVKLDNIKEYINPKGIKTNQEFYLCKCDCGKEKIISKTHLTFNRVKSCGCLQKEIALLGKNIIHNKYNSRLYRIFFGIKGRCYNINDKEHYKVYGSRGIIMCDDWKNDFMSFYNWAMANGYQKKLTIDRINNDGNYEPSNCRWVDIKTQNRNRSDNRFLTHNNETHCVGEWAEKLNIPYRKFYKEITRHNKTIQDFIK